jgi:hypothetical protein
MKTRTFIALFIIVILQSCYQVERSCEDYRTGTFKFDYMLDGKIRSSTFKRTEKFNIDYINDVPDTSSVRWINDCEFVLKKLHPKNRAEEKAIHMKILTTTDSSYSFEYRLAVKDVNKELRVEKGTAVRIKQ